ncbi:MAG: hypothetical protein ACOYN5_11480, partial [Bacteroidales bacterium]
MLIIHKRSIILIVLFGWMLSVSAQKAVIRVTDARNNDPIPYANVLIEQLDGKQRIACMTDLEGKSANTLSSAARLSVSALGYKLYTDTIQAGSAIEVKLDPVVYNMDEVVVTGQYTPQAIDKSIFRVKVIGSRQIEQRASNNLNDLMSGELNIRSSNDGALGSKIT